MTTVDGSYGPFGPKDCMKRQVVKALGVVRSERQRIRRLAEGNSWSAPADACARAADVWHRRRDLPPGRSKVASDGTRSRGGKHPMPTRLMRTRSGWSPTRLSARCWPSQMENAHGCDVCFVSSPPRSASGSASRITRSPTSRNRLVAACSCPDCRSPSPCLQHETTRTVPTRCVRQCYHAMDATDDRSPPANLAESPVGLVALSAGLERPWGGATSTVVGSRRNCADVILPSTARTRNLPAAGSRIWPSSHVQSRSLIFAGDRVADPWFGQRGR